MITQAELATYQRLKQQEKELNRQLEELRGNLLRLLETGSPVEPGPLSVRRQVSQQRRFTNAQVVKLIGKTAAADLQSRLEPTVYVQLIVRDKTGGY